MAKIGNREKSTMVEIRPTMVINPQDAKVDWTTDSVVRLSLLVENHLKLVVNQNPNIELRTTSKRFWPFITDKIVPLL